MMRIHADFLKITKLSAKIRVIRVIRVLFFKIVYPVT